MATDLTSRGLDTKGIDTVVNYDMPCQLAQAKTPVSSIKNSLISLSRIIISDIPHHNQYIGPLGPSLWSASQMARC